MRLLSRTLFVIVVSLGLSAGVSASGAFADAPEPESSIKSTWKELEQLLKSGDATCEELAPYLLHSAYRVAPDDPTRPVAPEEPLTDTDCSNVNGFGNALSTTTGTKFAEFGTGALVEGTAPDVTRGKAIVIFLLDTDNKWKAISAYALPRQVGTKLKPRSAWNRSANGFVKSIQKDDCDQTFFYLSPESVFVAGASGSSTAVCSGLRASVASGRGKSFDISESSKKPKFLGGTRNVGFYGLELENGRYVTLVLVKATEQLGKDHANPAVLDFMTSRQPDEA